MAPLQTPSPDRKLRCLVLGRHLERRLKLLHEHPLEQESHTTEVALVSLGMEVWLLAEEEEEAEDELGGVLDVRRGVIAVLMTRTVGVRGFFLYVSGEGGRGGG